MRRLQKFAFGTLLATLASTTAAIDIAQKPVFLNPPDPRIMLVISRDHELSKKAYNDVSDLNGGVLDTTYDDDIEYYGYFDPKRCYTYNTSDSGRFEPSDPTNTGTHQCSSQWSGNFLNWVSMTRMDVLRKTLYGGLRFTDNNGNALGDTVLERAMLPNDVHAFAKVFASADMAKYTPYTAPVVSFCNVTPAASKNSRNTGFPASADLPKIQVAFGSFPRWAMNESVQCATGKDGTPASAVPDSLSLTARVAVCVPDKLEDNCSEYGTNPNRKPTGLLQTYGESAALARVQFGLLTGSYGKNKSGGVLRKNTSLLTGNTSSPDNNEVDPATGVFINQDGTKAGIINTLNRIRISGWAYGNGSNGKYDNGCGSPGLLSFPDGQCEDWGNPLSEIYLESLRYFSGKSPLGDFDPFGAGTTETKLPAVPKVTWSDPLPSTEWCALSNVVVLSTGLNSFDRDQLTNHGITGLDPVALTNEVGSLEGISGGSYLIGSNGITSDNQCTAKSLTNLSSASGICPEVPSLQGGYHIAGLAYANQSVDLRPGYKSLRESRWGPGSSNPFAARQPIGTYTVALAESLPKFEIPVGLQQTQKITFLPTCMAQKNTNSAGNASDAISATNPPQLLLSNDWNTCSLTDLRILNIAADGSSGSLEASWEDSTWGNDYDMDGISRLDYCVGAACSPAVASNQLMITAQVVYAAAGHALRFGYTVTGSGPISTVIEPDNTTIGTGQDGTYLDILRKGDVNVPALGPKNGVTGPRSRVFTAGLSSAKLLENPLWYAAKYGKAQTDLDDNGNPDWDNDGNGQPDNFFKVTNPAGLFGALGAVFEKAGASEASASAIASNSTRLDTDTHVYQALFNSPAWTGELRAIPLSGAGVAGTPSWKASEGIPTFLASPPRKIATWNGEAWNSPTGAGLDFTWATITGPAATPGTQQNLIGSEAILDYIRGDQSNEQPGGSFRERATLLGDIVNSDPHFVAAENFGYDQPGSGLLPDVKTAYTTFRTDIKATRKRMIYVGVNDGMLHAIDAANTEASGGGDEIFAYVPNAVIPNLKNLASPGYQHQYFVDGSPNSGDAYLGGSWKTVLIGTLGAGGKAVFALDITAPDEFDPSKVIWEFTDPDLGHIMGRAHVARMNDGHWYAIFGNGYHTDGATNRKAILYLVPLDTSPSLGLKPIKLDTLAGDDNGLSEPALLDTNGDRIIDTIYAGDLKGNIWKFDVSGSKNQWDVAYKSGTTPEPLFKAIIGTTPQPITGALEIGAPPNNTGGFMIYFGTGRYLHTTDISGTPATQTAYGILDSGTPITAVRAEALKPQSFVFEGPRSPDDEIPVPVRVVSNNEVTYVASGSTVTPRGWYLDLLAPGNPNSLGERIISVPLLRQGRVIFTSIIPSASPCEQGGVSWITEVDAMTGARLAYSVFDYTGDDLFNLSDYATYVVDGTTVTNPVSSKKLVGEGLLKSPTVISAGEKEYKVGSGTAGGVVVITEKGMSGTPRSSWRQLFGQ